MEVPKRSPTISASSIYRPLSDPSDLLNGILSGSEQTFRGSAKATDIDNRPAKINAVFNADLQGVTNDLGITSTPD